MIQRRRISLAASVSLVLAVAACAVATAPPSAVSPSGAASLPGTSATPRATQAPEATPPPGTLAAELSIHTIPRDLSGTTLEFVSDGSAILYSSSRALDSGPAGAPDLWRYEPGADEPTLVWHNPERNHSIVKIAGDTGMIAFVEIPLTGERAWNLWLVPEVGADAILLDRLSGDDAIPDFVPSLAADRPTVAWTAFDRGPHGPVSQLLVAHAPDWKPRVIAERMAADGELWLPSIDGTRLVYTEVRYAADRQSDERTVHLVDLSSPASPPRRLDASGRATMPLIVGDSVVWKEADAGMNMFDWGRMYRYDLRTGTVERIGITPQERVNYPSAGTRFIAWWGRDAFRFGVYDLERGQARRIASYTVESQDNVLRPHVAGDLLVWLFVDGATPELRSELRWAYLPAAGSDRLGD